MARTNQGGLAIILVAVAAGFALRELMRGSAVPGGSTRVTVEPAGPALPFPGFGGGSSGGKGASGAWPQPVIGPATGYIPSAPAPAPVITGSGRNDPAPDMPILPPGTRDDVREAVEEAFNNGTLTNGQAEAVSQLYAPLYNPEPENTFDGYSVVNFPTAADAQAALDAYMRNFV